MTVALIDYGAGNLFSVRNALAAAGAADVIVTDRAEDVLAADRIVLPGVGAFAACAGALFAIPGMREALDDAVLGRGRPFLGVCVGMQLMAAWGEEGERTAGLGWIGGTVRAMPAGPSIRVPHMGWNLVRPAGEGCEPIAAGEAYFLHGYALDPDDPMDVLATTDHGGPVVAAVRTGPALGVQFHPEKSQRYGLDLLARFLDWRP